MMIWKSNLEIEILVSKDSTFRSEAPDDNSLPEVWF